MFNKILKYIEDICTAFFQHSKVHKNHPSNIIWNSKTFQQRQTASFWKSLLIYVCNIKSILCHIIAKSFWNCKILKASFINIVYLALSQIISRIRLSLIVHFELKINLKFEYRVYVYFESELCLVFIPFNEESSL